jgi:hypothetical protein
MPKKEKGKGRDNNEALLSTKRVNVFQLKQKEKDSIKNQDFKCYESNVNVDSNEGIATKYVIQSLETNAMVGAFAVSGIEKGMNDLDETELPNSRLSMVRISQDASSVNITSARVVDNVVIDAIQIEDNTTPFEGVPKRGSILRYMLTAIVLFSLLMAIIVPTIMFILFSIIPNWKCTIQSHIV